MILKEMKKSVLFSVAMAGMMAFTACSSDDLVGNSTSTSLQSNELKVRAGIANAPVTRAYDNKWSAGDEIGIFTLNADKSVYGTANLEYKSTLESGDNTASDFAAVGSPALLPTDANGVDVVAYYPFTAAASEGKCSFDLTDQSNQAAIDLLAAKAEGVKAENPTAVLNFSHKFAKIYMTVTAEGETNLDGLKANLAGLTAKADYDILNDQVTAGTETADVDMKVTGNVIEAIVVPSAEASHNLKLVLGGKTYKAAINAQFEAGKKYVYAVKFLADNKVEITGSGITDWVDVPGSDVIVTPGEPETPSFGYENVFMFGSATPGGWSMGDYPVKLTKLDDNTYTCEVALTAGEFKFPLNNDWGCDWIMPTENAAPLSCTTCQVVKDGASFDYKWNVTEDEAGTYKIVLNVKDMIMTATKVE